jgi:hypothetical protein
MFAAVAESTSNDPVSWMVRVYFAAGYETVRQKRPHRLGISPSPVLGGVSIVLGGMSIVLGGVSIAIAARAKRSDCEAHLLSSSTLNSDFKNEN